MRPYKKRRYYTFDSNEIHLKAADIMAETSEKFIRQMLCDTDIRNLNP